MPEPKPLPAEAPPAPPAFDPFAVAAEKPDTALKRGAALPRLPEPERSGDGSGE